jgi:hypothetical protein
MAFQYQTIMSANLTTALATSSSTTINTMPSWMSISHGETIGTDHPVPKWSLKKKLGNVGSAFKGFFKDHAKIYRIETTDTANLVSEHSVTEELSAAGSAVKGFFKDHAKIYRVEK